MIYPHFVLYERHRPQTTMACPIFTQEKNEWTGLVDSTLQDAVMASLVGFITAHSLRWMAELLDTA